MRRTFFGLLAVLSFASAPTAFAAELPLKAPPPPAPPPCIWCGFYVGFNAGGTWSDDTATYEQIGTPFVASTTLHPSGFIGGGQVGYNWETGGNIVFGVEADIDARDASDTVNGLMPFAPANTMDQVDVTETEDWLATVRGRLGLAYGNWLFYVTGGGAFGEVGHNYTQIRTTTGQMLTLSDSPTLTGWTAGVGAEYALVHNFSIGIEYLFVDLGDSTLTQGTTITSAGLAFPPSSTTFENRMNIVRLKVNWKFGAPLSTVSTMD
jgi:outer membrane immunogenic protein